MTEKYAIRFLLERGYDVFKRSEARVAFAQVCTASEGSGAYRAQIERECREMLGAEIAKSPAVKFSEKRMMETNGLYREFRAEITIYVQPTEEERNDLYRMGHRDLDPNELQAQG